VQAVSSAYPARITHRFIRIRVTAFVAMPAPSRPRWPARRPWAGRL
jgi:hypothetical protein